MKVIPTAEQREFAAALRGLLAAESPVSLVRALQAPGADRSTPTLWKALADESPVSLVRALAEPGADRTAPTLWKALADAGVFGLAIAEENGGSGGSLDDLAIFYIEAGRALCPTTVHSTVQAALAIDQLGPSDIKSAWLPPLANGNVRGTTALWSARDAAIVSGVLRADSVSTQVAAQRNCGLRRRRGHCRSDRGVGRRTRAHACLHR